MDSVIQGIPIRINEKGEWVIDLSVMTAPVLVTKCLVNLKDAPKSTGTAVGFWDVNPLPPNSVVSHNTIDEKGWPKRFLTAPEPESRPEPKEDWDFPSWNEQGTYRIAAPTSAASGGTSPTLGADGAVLLPDPRLPSTPQP